MKFISAVLHNSSLLRKIQKGWKVTSRQAVTLEVVIFACLSRH